MDTFIARLLSDNTNSTGIEANNIINIINSGLKGLECEDIGISETANIVAKKYEIEVYKGKIEEFSSPQADAYPVRNVEDGKEDYYCLIYNKNIPTRLAEIIALKAVHIPNLVSPLEIQIVPLGEQGEKFLCVVCKKPKGISLKELVKSKREFSYQYLLKKVISPINKILSSLHNIKIVHGRINPSNIYLDENDELTIGECISGIVGLSQHDAYETIGRAQCHKYGKGEGDKSIDYYALGMTIASIISKRFFEEVEHINLIESKLQNGTFSFLNNHYPFGGTMSDLLRGLVTDNNDVRWGYKEIENILMDGSYSLPNVFEKSALPRPVIFKEKEYFHKEALIYDLVQNWEDAKLFIKQSLLSKWLDISATEQATIEALESLQETFKKRFSSYSLFSKDDEHLMKVLIILDPNGPIRYKNTIFYKDGIGPLLVYSMVNQVNELAQFIANCLYVDLYSFYEQIANWFKDKKYLSGVHEFRQVTSNIKKGGYGFGIERCCYDLNISLPCQSHVLGRELCYGVGDVLKYLDNENVNIDEILSKKNLLCFVASKLELFEEFRVTKLPNFYMIEKDKTFVSLMILGIAQEKVRMKKLKNLSGLYAEKIKAILETIIKGELNKKNIFSSIDKIKSEGNLNLIKQSATDIKFLEQDVKGFSEAVARVEVINGELDQLRNRFNIERQARENGLKLAVKISYFIALISIILAIIGGI